MTRAPKQAARGKRSRIGLVEWRGLPSHALAAGGGLDALLAY